MSDVMLGANVEDLAALSKKLSEASTNLNDLIVDAGKTVASTSWTGPNADGFRSSWDDFNDALKKASTSLDDASSQVSKQLDGLQSVMGG